MPGGSGNVAVMDHGRGEGSEMSRWKSRDVGRGEISGDDSWSHRGVYQVTVTAPERTWQVWKERHSCQTTVPCRLAYQSLPFFSFAVAWPIVASSLRSLLRNPVWTESQAWFVAGSSTPAATPVRAYRREQRLEAAPVLAPVGATLASGVQRHCNPRLP